MNDKSNANISRSVAGRSVIVTGAASGIGRATALLFAREGARVAILDRDAAGGQQVAEAAREAGGTATAFAIDLTDADAIRNIAARVAEGQGGIDIVVNNAGISAVTAIDDPDYDTIWERHIAVLLTAQQRLIRAALPHLRGSTAPRIINIASTEALGATAQLSAYSAAKAGVVGLTRSLAVELGKEGITVNCVCPGPVETAMTADIPDDRKAAYAARRTALRRYGRPDEIAHMILSISLPAASYLTGAVIPVDGGLMARNA